MRIEAIVIDGYHKGTSLSMEYSPLLKLLKPKEITVDYCCYDGENEFEHDGPEALDYKECFRAVDKRMVLYSTTGNSIDVLGFFPHEVTNKPYTEKTVLYRGFHNEPVRRKN